MIAGPSGCGKSTLLAVLAGLLPPTSGSVHAGRSVAAGPQWQSQVAWLPQRPHFLHGSVAENLRLGDPDASEDQLWSALRRVALEERVRDLPGGLHADVGEDGKLLSAGERARLALARVLVADRPWVFMDEPTAHLDQLTELIIADTILELGRTSGVVVVAHDEAMLALGDQLLVLEPPPSAPPVAAPVALARGPIQRAVPAATEEEGGGSVPSPPRRSGPAQCWLHSPPHPGWR